MTETILDTAHAAMQADETDDAARLRFYEKLAGSELFLLLKSDAAGDRISPETFELSDGAFVLVFDREDRLAQFTGRIAPYAALSGRAICQMLAPQRLGLGLNLDVAPSSLLLPPEAVAWLAAMDTTPDEVTARIEHFTPPTGLPETFLTALDTRLAAATGLAESAYLVGAVYENGSAGHLLGFVGARADAQGALAQSVSQALGFSGLEAGTIDVGFFDATDTAAASLARVGLRFDLPQTEVRQRQAPGSDPAKPPLLR